MFHAVVSKDEICLLSTQSVPHVYACAYYFLTDVFSMDVGEAKGRTQSDIKELVSCRFAIEGDKITERRVSGDMKTEVASSGVL